MTDNPSNQESERTGKQMKNPFELLKEIEAYLRFRLLADEPTIPAEDMQSMKRDIQWTLNANLPESAPNTWKPFTP